jgi:hypothetical protein
VRALGGEVARASGEVKDRIETWKRGNRSKLEYMSVSVRASVSLASLATLIFSMFNSGPRDVRTSIVASLATLTLFMARLASQKVCISLS